MSIDKIRNSLTSLEFLITETCNLTKTENRYKHNLKSIAEQASNLIAYTNFSDRDRFYVPKYLALKSLEEYLEIDNKKFKTSFSTLKLKLLSILKKYKKGLVLGIKQHDLESN